MTRANDEIELLELGFQDGKFLLKYAEENPDLWLVGIECPSATGFLETHAPSNVDVFYDGALHRLQSIRDHSVSIVRTDFLLNDFSLVVHLDDGTFQEFQLQQVPWHYRNLLEEGINNQIVQTLTEIRRVLKPHGVLMITEYHANQIQVEHVLSALGATYQITSVPENELSSTTWLQKITSPGHPIPSGYTADDIEPIRFFATF